MNKEEAQGLWDGLPEAERIRLSVLLASGAKPRDIYINADLAPLTTATAQAYIFNENNAYDVCTCGHFRYSHGPGCFKCQMKCVEFVKEIH